MIWIETLLSRLDVVSIQRKIGAGTYSIRVNHKARPSLLSRSDAVSMLCASETMILQLASALMKSLLHVMSCGK